MDTDVFHYVRLLTLNQWWGIHFYGQPVPLSHHHFFPYIQSKSKLFQFRTVTLLLQTVTLLLYIKKDVFLHLFYYPPLIIDISCIERNNIYLETSTG